MGKLKLGIIGCGGMSESHANNYHELVNEMVVTAMADVIVERAQKMADVLGGNILVVEDYKDMIDHVDAVLIALPHDLHYEVSMYCLNAGKHVLVEKPLALNEQQCLELIETSKMVQRVLMTAYPLRYHPLVVKMKELIDNKVYGDVFQISMWTEQFTRFEPGHWSESADRLGGGQFFSHGCHYVDLLLWMMGRPVKGIHMGTNLGTPWMEKEGTSQVSIEFESGAIAYHAGTWGARGTKLGYNFQAHCTGGMIEFNYNENKLVVHRNLLWEDIPDSQAPSIEVVMELEGGGKYTFHEIRHFLKCIQSGDEPLTNGAVSLQGLRVIWRLYEAEERGIIADLTGLGLDEEWETKGLDRLPSVV